CEAVATGHYVRAETDPVLGRAVLRKGLDPEKDQSYFLYDLTPEQLAAARFPVGGLTKTEVRAHARRAGLPTADKEESQEICFVPQGTRVGDFVAAHASPLGLTSPPAAGPIEDASGERLGTHDGHFRFTIGQRRGIGVAASERLYVLSLDAAANRVVVGPGRALETSEATLGGVRFLWETPAGPLRVGARVRHRAAEVPATVTPGEPGTARVAFDVPVRAVTPGQSCVFYDGDLVVGGGVIRKGRSETGAG
ncbi:MAG TPA: aminomethyltransferase beta-barrel domain-containing protein, partial [Thermoanaerobaculia bacterium]|nr:aminomethyltransferase beta-barrel domain-containing protein [Thermoanaerobaculia bacterium]